jgi:hypothetical protein
MSDQRFVDGQRKRLNIVFALFVSLLTLMWVATALDAAFSLGWGWDRQGLWLGPLMVAFAILVRLAALAMLRFVGSNYP